MYNNRMLQGLPPIHRKDARLLILGSMPSAASLKAGQYYAHSTNAFWKIMTRLFGMADSYPAKRQLLVENRIALWDVIGFCEREGSLDSAIRNERYNDLRGFLRTHPKIERVLLNGGKAEKAFLSCMKDTDFDISYDKLPSTSSALTMPFEEKLKKWKTILG
jgi:double-stranded uracil-DNA glycosylase